MPSNIANVIGLHIVNSMLESMEESVSRLDEVSKQTLGSYLHKAVAQFGQARSHEDVSGYHGNDWEAEGRYNNDPGKFADHRRKNIEIALGKFKGSKSQLKSSIDKFGQRSKEQTSRDGDGFGDGGDSDVDHGVGYGARTGKMLGNIHKKITKLTGVGHDTSYDKNILPDSIAAGVK